VEGEWYYVFMGIALNANSIPICTMIQQFNNQPVQSFVLPIAAVGLTAFTGVYTFQLGGVDGAIKPLNAQYATVNYQISTTAQVMPTTTALWSWTNYQRGVPNSFVLLGKSILGSTPQVDVSSTAGPYPSNYLMTTPLPLEYSVSGWT
jgi:hypothetical protein